MNFKIGNRVKIISGIEKGKLGYIKQILRSKNKAKVQGLKLCFKHQKPVTIEELGSILKKEAYINISNLMSYQSRFNTPTRIFLCKLNKDEKPKRFSVKTGTIMEE